MGAAERENLQARAAEQEGEGEKLGGRRDGIPSERSWAVGAFLS